MTASNDPQQLLNAAQHYSTLGARVLFVKDKRALHEWKSGAGPTTPPADPSNLRTASGSLAWNVATGLAIVCGHNGWLCIDIDANKDTSVDRCVVDTLLDSLGLPPSYPWMVRSGSYRGYHIWLRCTYGQETTSAPWFLPLEQYQRAFAHIELRRHSCYTVVPPSVHEGGNHYQFLGEIPAIAPAVIKYSVLLEALTAVSVARKTKKNHNRIPHSRSSGLSSVPNTKLDEIKKRFDLITAIRQHLDTDVVINDGLEYRIGEQGAGHGGWYVTSDRGLWNTFIDGKGGTGGDCFDLIGFLAHGEGWDRNDPDLFLSAVGAAAAQVGITLDEEPTVSAHATSLRIGVEAVEAFIRKRFRLRHNIITGRLEWSPLDYDTWSSVTDQQMNFWLIELEKATGSVLPKDRWITYTDNPVVATPFDPFIHYFSGLEWDGHDHLGFLMSCAQTDDAATFLGYLRTWLVATYACAYHGGMLFPNELFLVLSGPQGRGKTRFLRAIIPPALSIYVHSGGIDESKDALILLSESFLSFNDELTSLRKADVEHIKALLSRSHIRLRRPYERYQKELPRRFSCCGTTNETEFLTDATGNRRFLVAEVAQVDLERLKGLNVDQLWAQVKHLFQSGTVLPYLTREQIDTLELRNADYRLVSREEELILRYLEPAAASDHYVRYLTTGEVAELLGKIFDLENMSGLDRNGVQRLNITPSMLRSIGISMKARGFERVSHRRGERTQKCYRVRVKSFVRNGLSYTPPV